jgi:hypothetical protein
MAHKLNIRTLFLISFFLTHIFLAAPVLAQTAAGETSTSQNRKLLPENWTSTLDYMYFSFQGVRPANGNIYDFEDVQLDLQMFTLKYAASPLVSYSAVATYQTNYAETYFLGDLYEDRTHGISDTLIKRTQVFVLPAQQLFILDVGLYLPTGSINERNQNNTAFNYPYNMQLGSGTFDPMVTTIYMKSFGAKHQLGALGLARLRTGEINRNGYRLGNDWTAGLWYSYLLNSYLTPSLKLNYRSIEGLSGVDPLITRNIFMEFYHNTRSVWDLTPTLAAKIPITKNITAQALLALPVWQRFSNIDDVEVETNWYGQLGIAIQ